MPLEKLSHCKVNLVLNILGRREDGYHEVETVMLPVRFCDRIIIEEAPVGDLTLTCSEPSLPVDSGNLVYRAARRFLDVSGVANGVRLRLEKRIPLAAGLGGGSGNAATTLVGLNELFDEPLSRETLLQLASELGSDVPFFLQEQPALGTGRGERIQPIGQAAALNGLTLLLIHPGFGISTPWAYRELARFPAALNGEAGRAQRMVSALRQGSPQQVAAELYNSLEFPALKKYPVLRLYQDFLRSQGAFGALMSGSGSTTFALLRDIERGEQILERFRAQFGGGCWTALVPV
jgi:4-diphosphocytidyl-2-C-methyl-D-erythritol kinase